MNAEILVEWNPWWAQKQEFGLIDREIKHDILEWLGGKEIIGILGVRRCGKTSLMSLVIEHLLKTVDAKNIFFIKCDDDRVKKEGLISEAMELYREVINPTGRIFVFADEVQEVPEWESTLKRVYDLEKDVKFFVSGSNFSVLREDLAFKLAGRLAHFELYPFSFAEFLKLRNIKLEGKAQVLSRKHEIKHSLLEYFEFGGFPEVVLEEDTRKKGQLLRFYYDTIVYRDILKRREVRNPAKMEQMINFLLQNISGHINFSKVGRLVSLSTDSIGEYVKYLQDAFFMFTVPLFSYSVKKQEINPKKIYCVDLGIRNIKGFRFSQDYGKFAENAVFVELKRRGSANPLQALYYWQGEGCEVDFVVKEGLKVKRLIQVCWDMGDSKVKERELKGLIGGLKEFKLKEGAIITGDAEGTELVDGKKVYYIPLWKWLLGAES
ncbi:ATP-binding protein [Candidatus Woesearchaeota archaeon]|nr:ATP-binding protein [Candidatus Woesearchaeota archaeon]